MGNPRASVVRRDGIDYSMQLIVDDEGNARLTRIPGQLKANERAIELQLSVPMSVFKRPALRAEISVSPAEISIPPIKVEAMQTALRDAFGADVILTIQSQEPPQ